MDSTGIFNTYYPMVSLILWHFPEKFIVPPFATITWHFGAGYRKQFNSLATLQWKKLWVLPESINTITFFFLICPSILRVWGVVIPANALHDMVGLIYSSSRVGSWCISSSFWFWSDSFLTTVAKPFFSFFFQLLWCQPCSLWKSRCSNTSIFIDVSGRLPCCHNFTFNFSCQPEYLLQWIRFPNMKFMLDVIL